MKRRSKISENAIALNVISRFTQITSSILKRCTLPVGKEIQLFHMKCKELHSKAISGPLKQQDNQFLALKYGVKL